MSVYVDDAFISAAVVNGGYVHQSRWCHLTADSTRELLAFARRIGLRPEWIQHQGEWHEHFDLTEPKRRRAVAAGAIQVRTRDRVEAMQAAFLARRTAGVQLELFS